MRDAIETDVDPFQVAPTVPSPARGLARDADALLGLSRVAVVGPVASRLARFVRTAEGRHQLWGYLFLLPMFVLLVTFKFVPMLQAFQLSFTSYDLLSPPRYVGFANYVGLVQDPLFRQSITATLYYVFGTCLPIWVLSLALALVFNRRLPFKSFLRFIYFLPTIMPVVVFAVVWRFMFHPYGLMNVGLGTFGIPPVNWLLDTKAVMPGIIFASEWRFVPFFMILYLTGLQNIPPEYYEAASLDGASKWQTFRYITLPLLKPTMLLVIVVSIITMSKVFTLALVLTEGGPNGATRVVPMFIYENGFQYFKMGRATAASIFLLFALMVVTLAQLRIFREERT